MPKIVRYNGNLKAFASEQLTNERTLFGEVTIADDLTSQVTAQFLRGWGIVGPSDQPSLQDFNAAMYTNGQLLAYLHQMGVAEYNAAQEYFIGSLATVGAVLYMSITNANIGNTPSASPASWKAFTADQATEVALGLVKIATQALTNAGTDDLTAVTPRKLSTAIQGQKHTAFSTTGTATVQVLAPVPAITAYSATQRFNVTFNVASGVNPTINVSGQGAKLLKQYDSSGAKVSAVFAANQNSDIFYDGTDWVLLDRLPPNSVQVRQGVRGSALNWKGLAGGVSANISYSCDRVTVEDGAGNITTLPAFSLTLNTSVSASATVDGMASGATIASTWYNVFVWYNPTTGVIRLTGDISATAPTPPAAGFTQWARRSTFRTDATANKFPLRSVYAGNGMQYSPAPATNLLAAPVVISGSSGNPASPPTWAAVSVSPFIPPTASRIRVYVTGYNGGTIAAPNNSYGGLSASAIQGAPIMVSPPAGNSASNSSMGDFILESTNIYYASGGAASSITCIGFEDSL